MNSCCLLLLRMLCRLLISLNIKRTEEQKKKETETRFAMFQNPLFLPEILLSKHLQSVFSHKIGAIHMFQVELSVELDHFLSVCFKKHTVKQSFYKIFLLCKTVFAFACAYAYAWNKLIENSQIALHSRFRIQNSKIRKLLWILFLDTFRKKMKEEKNENKRRRDGSYFEDGNGVFR